MLDHGGWILASIAVFTYALVARRVAAWAITPPMIFLAVGYALSSAGLLVVGEARHVLHLLAEATLAIVLFSDAASIDLRALRARHLWPQRMLLFGLPLAIGLGFAAAYPLLAGWTIAEVALLAAILAPTDAALGQAVVTDRAVPERVRRALGVESGLNDGLALPAVLFFGCLAVGGVHDGVQDNWLIYAARQIGFGTLVGAAVGSGGGWMVRRSADRSWSNDAFEGLAVLALAALAYIGSGAVGGNGFIAAFVAGLGFGAVLRDRCRFVFEFMETEGQGLVLFTFLLVGAALVPEALASATTAAWLIVPLSLFVVRPLAIGLSLVATDASMPTRLFLGWFGPRGLATVVFALLVVGELEGLRRGEEILTIAVVTVVSSTLLHGLSAAPAARRFGRRSEAVD